MIFVIDASALILMLEGRSGASDVIEALPGARVSVLSIAEVAIHFQRLGMPVGEIDVMLRRLPIQRVGIDHDLAWGIVTLGIGDVTLGRSLGFLVALALAVEAQLPLMTADPDALQLANSASVETVAVGMGDAPASEV